MSSSLSLAPGVYAAAVGPDLVLLDTARDAYFCLPEAGDFVAARLACGELAGLSPTWADELTGAGLAQAAVSAPRRAMSFVPPGRDLLDAAPVRPTAAERLGFVGGLLGLLGTYRGRPFARVLLHAAGRRLRLTDAAVTGQGAAARRARVFLGLMPWSPIQGACLMQSALCLTYLAQAGLAADWVFGVRTWPFSAHCWVQAGDLVLNDSAERVAAYKPILKI